MRFLFYDIIFLIIFSLSLIVFLYKRRKNLKREGLLYLYRTRVGIKFINYIGKKYKKTLNVLGYFVIFGGYGLMIAMLYLLGQLVYVFAKFPEVVRAIKVPPLMPLIPYLPSVFKIEFLPPFYFTYWIVAIAIIAVSHEFSHGIFARLNNIKVKSTGFGFLGPFLAAFVEPDEKKMSKKKKFQQITVLSAGSFANLVMTILFFVILYLFFISMYTAAGAMFTTYTYSSFAISTISSIGGYEIKNSTSESILNLIETKSNGLDKDIIINLDGDVRNLTKIETDNGTYFLDSTRLKMQLNLTSEDVSKDNAEIVAYDNAPAINAGLKGVITEFNDVKVKNNEELSREIKKYSPGDKVIIKTRFNDTVLSYEIKLGESPYEKNRAFLGIGTRIIEKSGVIGFLYNIFNLCRDPNTYYEPRFDSNLIIFIYNLLWWIIIINISVALVNMLPVGIFDGGRVFFLTMFALTKNERLSKRLFSIATAIILSVFLLLMIFWFFSFV